AFILWARTWVQAFCRGRTHGNRSSTPRTVEALACPIHRPLPRIDQPLANAMPQPAPVPRLRFYSSIHIKRRTHLARTDLSAWICCAALLPALALLVTDVRGQERAVRLPGDRPTAVV